MSECGKGGKATLRVKQEKEQTDHGGEERRDSKKRHRTSTTNSNNIISGSDTTTTTITMMNKVVVLSSTTAASQSNAVIKATAVATSTASAIKNKITNSEGDNVPTRCLPTKDELKKELYKLVDTDHYSRDESLQALHRFLQWNSIRDTYSDNLQFNDYFYEYAGLQIVLDFVEKFSNDAECVENSISVVQKMVYNQYRSKPGEGTHIIFSHGGIEILLQSSNMLVEGNLNGPKLGALESIWNLFGDIFSYTIYPSGTADRTADRTKIDTTSKSFKDRFYSIVDSCLDLLTKIQSRDDQTSLGIMSKAFSILGKASKISTDMKDSVVNGEIRKKGIIPKTVEVFKMDDGSCNFRDNKLIRCALRMLTDLNNNNLLTQASDFQSVLPLLAVALKEFLFTAITLLEKATDAIENKSTIEKAGVLGALVPLLERDDTRHVKDRVRNLVANICSSMFEM
ncbi:hypothetical protein FRACYDRAFT_264496 [Fragilariopsis cylindrus CCMP1102]|uniref:ARM repeat-containing protein n=1 Tax=Fragilariopsis cylindrus CCMP1102 TaxID=635003 RepID=A0A1E7ERW4_9STRA|nr:hypothetical protein FRACYDRAFT_264496 [Fragilariopsis cylindrus CCMP1102]|eukprot:OEU08577.1 hypothetical protein FRACYDRAFT_264496 [Fragilariopsis cylindrus CCMP1102]